jgi:predicted nucleic acid-binding protein
VASRTDEKVYLETSVISYLVSRPSRDLVVAAHQQITRQWWEECRESFQLYVSQMVIQEAGSGDPAAAQRRLGELVAIPLLGLTDEAQALARELIENGALPRQAVEDALHIALATVHGMDYLLTWNCRHIANARMREAVVSVCMMRGYEPPVICTPEELMGR